VNEPESSEPREPRPGQASSPEGRELAKQAKPAVSQMSGSQLRDPYSSGNPGWLELGVPLPQLSSNQCFSNAIESNKKGIGWHLDISTYI